MKTRPRKRVRSARGNGRIARERITPNVHAALRDESYTIIQRLVDETLKDPEIREKIELYTRKIIRLIARNI